MVALVAAIALVGVTAGVYWIFLREREAPPAPPQVARTPWVRPTPLPSVAPTAAPELPGALEIDASEAGAVVTVDGRQVGTVPQRLELSPGRHRVRVERDGFAHFTRDVGIVSGRTARLSARLAPGAPLLRVDSDVPGATVFIDRKPEGKTPLELRDLPSGSYRLNVTAEGYEMYSDNLELTSGTREVMVRFKEVRLDEAIEVFHKHGVGSCQGRLVATVDGLRYEASEAKDAFRAAWGGVERLQTDYLKKNLRVKLKGGRTYNFTGDSADTLLSFQQKVEAARKRM